ncbi:hypothetical protein PG985_000881 [Apiospora marii]|uniref:Glucose receptor Git3 N-terminal domain-containing protein n=1 Tax=Apiospora marii TaxID=335849 RepID=A0ABR1RGB8_9PEZI
MDTREKGNGTLAQENDTLYSLGGLRSGLVAVAVVSIVSFVTTAALLAYLLSKLLIDAARTRLRRRQQLRQRPGETRSEISLDLSLSMPVQRQLEVSQDNPVSRSHSTRSYNHHQQPQVANPAPVREPYQPVRNPFPFLIISILAAECHTALGMSLNLVWLLRDGIYVGTAACTFQGWLNSMGILYSSMAFICMATSNYLAIVWGFRARNTVISVVNFVAWLLTLGLVFGGMISGKNGKVFGGWYVRANAWCWVNPKYSKERLWSCWSWVMFSIPYTCLLYSLIFWKIWRQKRRCRRQQTPGHVTFAGAANLPSGYHPAFFIYPFVYNVCTIPLAIIRLKQSIRENRRVSGDDSPVQELGNAYYCLAAFMVSSNGLWNTVLWLTTMFVSTPEDIRHAGLGAFAVMRTPEWRKFGNMVWISGPMSKGVGGRSGRGGGIGGGGGDGYNNESQWWWWRMGGQTRLRTSSCTTQGPSQEFLHVEDNGIQMDVVTTITVEEAVDLHKNTEHERSPKHEKPDDTDSST